MLPIETIRTPLLEAVRRQRHFVLQAEPGAGKTTRVPVMLLEAGLAAHGEIVVAQPRRIAARLAATRVAHTLGEPVGQTCGYQVRFESKVGRSTKIRFVTEGLLLRQLRDDPQLANVAMVILDEFHERHLATDVALAILKRLAGTRHDFRIGVMSATLDAEPVAAYLGCEALCCEGRAFAVQLHHLPRASERPLDRQVANALRERGASSGSVLVFLPGAAEIRGCARSLAGQAEHLGLELATLHGDMPAREQDRTVRAGNRPKLILSTNVAETSVTIDHVTTVIDSGLARVPRHNPWTGVPMLALAKISRASATQRAGRAGRTGPGQCFRLYTQADCNRRRKYDVPELQRLDLTSTMLDLHAAGVSAPEQLQWLDAPPQAAVRSSCELLQRLGALDTAGALTDVGRAMLRAPVHPRLARLLAEARARGIGALGAAAAALLSERRIRARGIGALGAPRARGVAPDLLNDLYDLDRWRNGTSAQTLGVDPSACRVVQKVREQLERHVGARGLGKLTAQDEDALRVALVAAFPDRIGRVRVRPSGGLELVFADGGSAQLDDCGLPEHELAVALAAEERRERGSHMRVRLAMGITLDDLLELDVDRLDERDVVQFDRERERVVAVREVRFGGLLVDQTRLHQLPAQASDVLFDAAVARGVEQFLPNREDTSRLEARTQFAAQFDASVPVLDSKALKLALRTACASCTSFAQLRAANLTELARNTLPAAARATLERLAPDSITLATGRRLRVHYAADRDPWIESRLQDFFGQSRSPTVADGRQPLVLHLLAPNKRAVQVTSDLAGFWTRHYPEQRRVLSRRYPKHSWPQSPLDAKPPPVRPPRARKR